jgi:hypothetical protein
MRRNQFYVLGIFLGFGIFLLLSTWKCAGSKAWYGNEKSGYLFQYRFSETTMKYDVTLTQKRTVDMQGQLMEMGNDVKSLFLIQGQGSETMDDRQLTVTIDHLDMTVTGSDGKGSVEGGHLIGKPFGMTITPWGKVKEYKGIDSLDVKLDLRGPGRSNVKDFFTHWTGNFFPLLPRTPKRIGDSWTVNEDTTQVLGGITVQFITEAKHSLDGYESIDGIPCLMVNIKGETSMVGEGNEGRVTLEGDFEWEVTYYYDYKQGLIMNCMLDMFGEASVAATGAGAMHNTVENIIKFTLIK